VKKYINSKSIQAVLLLFVLGVAIVPTVGCGDSNAPIQESKESADKRLENAKLMRSLFEKSGGQYSKFTAEDKAAFDKLTGGETQSKEAFSRMGGNPN